MLGGTRNGRVVKVALLMGTILVTLYFLISWRTEAQSLTKDLEVAEEEYARLVKKLGHLERELKAKHELEAKYKTELESKKNEVIVLEREKTELQEQIQAVKADRDTKSQEAQRLREEMHEAKEAADDKYQGLSATCIQNQQTCERQAKQAEGDLSSARSEAATCLQSLVECKNRLTVQQELADSCSTRLTSLQKEETSRLNEIEQIQSQLHRAQQENEKLVAQMHYEQRNSLVGQTKLKKQNERGNFHGGDAGVRDRRDDGFRVGDHGFGNHGDQFHRIEDWDNRFHRIENQDGQFLNRDNQFHGGAKESFDDFKISDEQKQSVLNSLQGKVARGEKLDERQLKILRLLSREFGERKNHVEDNEKNAPVHNDIRLEKKQEQQKEAADIEDWERLGDKKPKQEEQLPNPLDEGEVKDLVEEQQKPGEFDNLGGDRKLEVVNRDQEEAVGAGGEELNQAVAAKDDHREEENKERGKDYIDKDGGQEGKKGNEREGDNPLPKPLEDEENPDDEDDYPGAKKDKDQEDDVYGDQAYKQDKEQFKNERLQQKFDRQL